MTELDIIDVPAPFFPTATLQLPDDAGSVRVKIKKVGNADSLSPHFYVELPAWERWTRTAGGMPLAGLSPSAIGTWAPAETVLFDEEGGRRIGDLLIGYLNTQTCPA